MKILAVIRERPGIPLLVCVTVLVVAAGIAGRPAPEAAAPRRPASDGEVLERLPRGRAGASPRAQELARLTDELRRAPRDLAAALRVARMNIEESRARADPRPLGYAQAALAPWWHEATPPPSVLVLRATIRQARHDFVGALADLDQAVAREPGDPQAWLTRSVVLSVLARHADAADSCAPLARLATALAYKACAARIWGLTGQATSAHRSLAGVLAAAPASPPERAWAVSVLGELAVWSGDARAAEAHFKEALSLDPGDDYARGAYADLLLDAGRPHEAMALLRDHARTDGLLLRLALAASAAGSPDAGRYEKILRAHFAAGRLRGDALHDREEARFELGLGKNPGRALELAITNWRAQREPWDARVMLEAGVAAGRPEAARPALAWLADSGFEEPTIRRLGRAIEGLP